MLGILRQKVGAGSSSAMSLGQRIRPTTSAVRGFRILWTASPPFRPLPWKLIGDLFRELQPNNESSVYLGKQWILKRGFNVQKNYSGFVGDANGKLSLINIDMTSDMVGRSAAFSCTQSRPTWMHLNSCSSINESSNVGSINSSPAPSFHNSHA